MNDNSHLLIMMAIPMMRRYYCRQEKRTVSTSRRYGSYHTNRFEVCWLQCTPPSVAIFIQKVELATFGRVHP